MSDIGKDNVFVHLDTHHMNIEESDFTAACKACGDKLRCLPTRAVTRRL